MASSGSCGTSVVQRVPRGRFFWGLLRLARPANIITAHADILAGFAASGATNIPALPLLLLSTTGLYGGGIVFNDVFDAGLDRIERPERPIPSGLVPVRAAAAFGTLLLVLGITAAACVSSLSGVVAAATAAAALVYDCFGKRHSVLGPVNMGLCRALNLMLGVTAGGSITPSHWLIAAVPLCYIAGITTLSSGEVKGGSRRLAKASLAWLATGIMLFIIVAISRGWQSLFSIPFAAILLFRTGRPFVRALSCYSPLAIRQAVKAGVLSLIMLDATLAALYAGLWYPAGILCLYIPAIGLARLFAVT
jgi:4-hydroxybenzoate polyprenyltransferase